MPITVPEPVENLVQKALSDCGGNPYAALYAVAATAHAAMKSSSAGMARRSLEG
jgi:hypothetical protein